MLGSLQLKRYSAAATMKGDDVFKPNTLKLYNARRTYFLQADNADAMSRYGLVFISSERCDVSDMTVNESNSEIRTMAWLYR